MRRCARMLLALLVPLLALNSAAVAEISTWPGETIAQMLVANCEEWVSLRAEPSISSERLAQIPLETLVYNCAPRSGGFIHCETVDGMSGYVLSEYLVAPTFCLRTAAEGTEGTPIQSDAAQIEVDWTVSFDADGLRVLCARDYEGERGERLRASCFDAQGNFLWGLCTETLYGTELDLTDAYAGGAPERPLLLVNNADLGLAAIDPSTGALQWTVDGAQVFLGGSQSHAVAGDGTLYVGGYYGPHPVAISANGEVLWQSDAGENAVWLYEIRVEGDEIVALYDAPDGDGLKTVRIDRATGRVIAAE